MDAPQPHRPQAPFGAPAGWPQTWPPQPPQAQRPPYEGMAVGALAAGVVLLFPLALVLGIVALARLSGESRGRRGGGLAIAAVTLAAAEAVALSVLIPAMVLRDDAADDGRPEASAPHRDQDPAPGPGQGPGPGAGGGGDDGAGGEEISVYDLRVGDCFDTGGGLDSYDEQRPADELTVTRLPCVAPHEAEAFGTTEVTGYDAFPGEHELTNLAVEECGRLVQPYVVDIWTLGTDVQTFFYYPQRQSWQLGDRELLCFFGRPEGGSLDASLRGDEGEMTEKQLRYLEITTPLEVVVWNEPLAGSLQVRQDWAGQMAVAVAAEAEALRLEEWSSAVAGLVTDVAVARESSVEHWLRAEQARSMTEYDTHYEAGWDTLGITEEIAVRDALGLATGE